MNTCNLCNKTFEFNYLLERHQNRKKSCANGGINGNIDTAKRKYDYQVNKINKLNAKTTDKMCGYCDKIFTSKSNLNKHMNNNCRNKTSIEKKKNELKNIYDIMFAQQQKLKEENKNKQIIDENNKKIELTEDILKDIKILEQIKNLINSN